MKNAYEIIHCINKLQHQLWAFVDLYRQYLELLITVIY